MSEARHGVYDKVGYVKERVEILHGTLLGVYMDWKEGVHDLGVSMEELYEGMGRAQEAAGEIQEILELLKKHPERMKDRRKRQ